MRVDTNELTFLIVRSRQKPRLLYEFLRDVKTHASPRPQIPDGEQVAAVIVAELGNGFALDAGVREQPGLESVHGVVSGPLETVDQPGK